MVKAKTEIKVKGYDHFDQYRAFEFRSLSDDQVGLLHEASLEIMARTGMRFFEQEALELFKKAGADVSDGNLVRLPPHLVEWALRTVPKNITLFDQSGRRASLKVVLERGPAGTPAPTR